MESSDQQGSLGKKLHHHPSPQENTALDWQQMGPKIHVGLAEKRRKKRWPFFWLLGLGSIGILLIGLLLWQPSTSKLGTASNDKIDRSDTTVLTNESLDPALVGVSKPYEGTPSQPWVAVQSDTDITTSKTIATPANREKTTLTSGNSTIQKTRVPKRKIGKNDDYTQGTEGDLNLLTGPEKSDHNTENSASTGVNGKPETLGNKSPESKQNVTVQDHFQRTVSPKTETISSPVSVEKQEASEQNIPSYFPATIFSTARQNRSFLNSLATKIAATEINPPVEITPTKERSRRPIYLSLNDSRGLHLGDLPPGPTEIFNLQLWEVGAQLDVSLMDEITFYTGIQYQQFLFTERFNGERTANIFAPGSPDTIFINTVEGTQTTVFTDSLSGTQIRSFQHRNTISTLGFPIMIGWNSRASGKRFAFEIRGGVDVGIFISREGRTISPIDGFTSEDLRRPSDLAPKVAGRLELVSYFVGNKKDAGYLAFSYRHPFSAFSLNGNPYEFRTLSFRLGYYLSRW